MLDLANFPVREMSNIEVGWGFSWLGKKDCLRRKSEFGNTIEKIPGHCFFKGCFHLVQHHKWNLLYILELLWKLLHLSMQECLLAAELMFCHGLQPSTTHLPADLPLPCTSHLSRQQVLVTHLPLLAMPMFSLHSTFLTNLPKGLPRVETSNIYDFPPLHRNFF